MGKTLSTGFLSTVIGGGIPINSGLKCHSSNYQNCTNRMVEYIVIHYTGNMKDTAKANGNFFHGPNKGASAHFFVDDREIYQSVELRDVAWHCGTSPNNYKHKYCRNNNSIGIEMCTTAGNYQVSATTKKNTAALCAYLCQLIGIPADKVDTYVVRHYDVTGKECPKQMSGKNNAEWKEFKQMVKDILKGSSTTTKPATTTNNTKVVSSAAYRVKINTESLNIRSQASADSIKKGAVKRGEVYTIIEEKNGWGLLKSKVGWIKLSYTKRV